jgi:hypothetical protein
MMKCILSVSPKKIEGRIMSRIEKRLNIDFKELVIHQLHEEIAPELFMVSEQDIKKFNALAENVQDYLAANSIKVIEQDGKYVIISGISQYLKLSGNGRKINVINVLNNKYKIDALIAVDILTSDFHLWHPHAEKIYAQVLGYLQDTPNISKEAAKLTYLNLGQFDVFIRGVSIFSRAKYYELKKVDRSPLETRDVISFLGELPLKFLNGNETDDILKLNFDDKKQFISAQIKNKNTESDVTSKVSIEEASEDNIRVTLSLDVERVIEVRFTKHIDLIIDNHRLIFYFTEEDLSHGTLYTDGFEKPITLSETGYVMSDGKAFGTITLDHKKYVLETFKKSRLESDIKYVLLTPCEVQS